jgi:hypothetical protein
MCRPYAKSAIVLLGRLLAECLSVQIQQDLPPDVKPLLRDPRQTSRTGGNSKRHIYAYRGVCRYDRSATLIELLAIQYISQFGAYPCRQQRKGHDRWQSQISFMGVNHYLGTFDR